MSKIAQIWELVSRFNLGSQIRSGMPGYVISLYTKSGSRSFTGDTSETLAYLRGYGDALYVTNPSTPFYNENDLPCKLERYMQMVAGFDYGRFDIVSAYYWYYTNYHNGMMSREYARLCKMQRYYKPGLYESMPTTYAAAYIYNQLQSKSGFSITDWQVDDSGEILWCNDSGEILWCN